MKKISVKSVVHHSLLISILAVLLAGCTTENQQSENSEPTPIAPSTESQTTPQQTQTISTQSETPDTSLETQNINGAEPTEEQNVVAVREESGLGVNLETVFFQFDSSALTPGAEEKLLQIAESMKNNPKLSIQIEGYTDEIGTKEYNLNLGKMRAQAVKDFLVAQGVNSEMLSTISYGEKKAAVKGSTAKAWKQNRRVEFKILP
ncbi:MAG: OmpA family protein [Xenococcaceae cyanobacterium MO_167.B27]|nr:OmpA family protein [Xenococcaceae cyanobacterium MO_167.B27]